MTEGSAEKHTDENDEPEEIKENGGEDRDAEKRDAREGDAEEDPDENNYTNGIKEDGGEERDVENGDAEEDTAESHEPNETTDGGEEGEAEQGNSREEDAEEEDAERSDADGPLKDGWEPWVRTWVGADGAFELDPEVLCFVVGSGIDTRRSDFFPGQIKRLTRPEGNSVPKLEDSSYTVPRHVEDGKILQQLTHETGVASAIAGRMSGIAPGATLVDVEADINTCSSDQPLGFTHRSLESRLEDIAQYLSANPSKAIVNLSLGRGEISNFDREKGVCKCSQSWTHPPPPQEWSRADHAIAKITESGALVVTCAGNECCPAFSVSPACNPFTLVVGTVNTTDGTINRWASFGRTVDVYAPGIYVQGADPRSESGDEYVLEDGTSFSAAIVSGLAIRYLTRRGTAWNHGTDFKNALIHSFYANQVARNWYPQVPEIEPEWLAYHYAPAVIGPPPHEPAEEENADAAEAAEDEDNDEDKDTDIDAEGGEEDEDGVASNPV